MTINIYIISVYLLLLNIHLILVRCLVSQYICKFCQTHRIFYKYLYKYVPKTFSTLMHFIAIARSPVKVILNIIVIVALMSILFMKTLFLGGG